MIQKSSSSRQSRESSSNETREQSALDMYRQWLDEASSSGNESDDDVTSPSQPKRAGMDLPRPTQPQEPLNKPTLLSPRKQLHPLSADQSSQSPNNTKDSKEKSPVKAKQGQAKPSTPRRIMQQMSFRSILSPSPMPVQPTAEKEAQRRGSKRSSRQASLGNLFSDAWIAQPAKTRRPSGPLAKAAHAQPMYDIPLDTRALPHQRTLSDLSDKTVAASSETDEKYRMKKSESWEFHPLDSKRGWLVVWWAFVACFVSLSTLVNYPIYESYYINTTQESGALEDKSQGDEYLPRQTYLSTYVVLIGTLMSGFAALGSLGAGIASDILGLRLCALAGTLVLSLGLLSSAFLDRLWALCITQGVIGGVGIAMMAIPAYTAPSHWFERSRAAATGTAVAGTGLGVLVLTPAYRSILQTRGLAICLFVQTIVTLVLGIGSSLGLRMRIMPSQKPPYRMKWLKVLSDLRVLALMAMAFFAAAARFAQLLCLPMFARAAGVEGDAGGVLYVVGAALLLGMLAGGAVADKTGYIAGIGLSELVLGIFTLVLYTPSSSIAPLYAFSVVFGLTTGTLAAVLPAAIAQMFGTSRLASSTGLVLAACAPALLATTPAALKFLHLLDKGHSTAWLSGISGVFSVVAGSIGMLLPVLQRRYVRIFAKRETDISW
ncbi:major facilitator superfamily domain-containing protein [Coemansia mojavensis]|nr:major facilitator superfamily domain-containing protein [Coemansia mojavensis]